ncbi:MAG TPA: hypothetical protein VLM75_05570 [Spirochaetota bacterium]|nr:hypothetical protein [Spirochaetota bacterium]
MTMPINQYKQLCSASEWKLAQESLPGAIESFSAAKIKTKLAATRRLLEKWRNLAIRQKREAGKRETALRSNEKARLFAVVVRSYEKRQIELERQALREKARQHREALRTTGPDREKTRAAAKPAKAGKAAIARKDLGTPAKIKGHISSRNRRDQAKRDGK